MDQCPGAVLINVFQRMENKMDNVTLENTARNSIEISQSDKKNGFSFSSLSKCIGNLVGKCRENGSNK